MHTGQHFTTVCSLLSTCVSVCLGRKDSRTLIHCMSERSHSHIPVERDISQHRTVTLSYKYLIKSCAAVMLCPSEFHCLFNLLRFSRNLLFLIIKMELCCVPVLEELTMRLEWRSADEIGQAKQNYSRRERIWGWRCICGNNSFFPVHQDKARECLEYKCVIALSLACHGSSKYLN